MDGWATTAHKECDTGMDPLHQTETPTVLGPDKRQNQLIEVTKMFVNVGHPYLLWNRLSTLPEIILYFPIQMPHLMLVPFLVVDSYMLIVPTVSGTCAIGYFAIITTTPFLLQFIHKQPLARDLQDYHVCM